MKLSDKDIFIDIHLFHLFLFYDIENIAIRRNPAWKQLKYRWADSELKHLIGSKVSLTQRVGNRANALINNSNRRRSSFCKHIDEVKKLRAANETIGTEKTNLIDRIHELYNSTAENKYSVVKHRIWDRLLNRVSEVVKMGSGNLHYEPSIILFNNRTHLHKLFNELITKNRDLTRTLYKNIYTK
jgi:hypothetical protein